MTEATVESFDARTGRFRLTWRRSIRRQPSLSRIELSSGQESPVLGVRYLLGLAAGEPIPPVSVRLGTTRGTNALISRHGAKTALLITQGFGDLPSIGYQNRSAWRCLNWRSTQDAGTTTSLVIEINEQDHGRRSSAFCAPDLENPVRSHQPLTSLRRSESLRCFLHGFAFPAHEQIVTLKSLTEAGFTEISVSSQVRALVKIVARCDTTAMDAYLKSGAAILHCRC